MQLLHDDVVLEVWVSSEVEANSVAQFVILERLDLRIEAGKRDFFFSCYKYASAETVRTKRPTSRSVM